MACSAPTPLSYASQHEHKALRLTRVSDFEQLGFPRVTDALAVVVGSKLITHVGTPSQLPQF